MSQRLNYAQLSGAFVKKFYEFSASLKDSSISAEIRHLVDIRASQLNGCAFCVDMHIKEAKIAGEGELRLHHIAIWHESPLFDARERAALEWTEALTRLPAGGVPDSVYDSVRAQFSEKEISDLTFSIMSINGWNRVSVAFRSVPGSQDATYGLTKAVFS